MTTARTRAEAFCSRLGLRLPVLLSPMAGACPPAMSAAVANAGGMGGCGALLLDPDGIAAWAQSFRSGSNGAFQINLWIPDAHPTRDPAAEAQIRDFLGHWGPPVPADAADTQSLDFGAQCDALLAAAPQAVSSIMGLYPPDFVARLKARGIAWFACVTKPGRGPRRRRRRCGRAGGAGRGGRWPSRRVRPGGRGAPWRHAVRPVAPHRRPARPAADRRGGHRGRPRHRSGADPGGERRSDRHRAAADHGGGGAPGMVRRTRPDRGGPNRANPRLQRPAGPQRGHRLRRGRRDWPHPGALPRATRP